MPIERSSHRSVAVAAVLSRTINQTDRYLVTDDAAGLMGWHIAEAKAAMVAAAAALVAATLQRCASLIDLVSR
jgi:hypothetical protein